MKATVVFLAGAVPAAVRQQVRAHALLARLLAALSASVAVEVVAARLHLTHNILWLPSTPPRPVALAALLLAWLPGARQLAPALRRRRSDAGPGTR